MSLNIKLNKKASIKIILNGEEIYKINAERCILPISKTGKYRVEFSYKNRGFAYTNPIVVK